MTINGGTMDYYFSALINADFDESIERVTQELKKEGFGILTDIDVAKKFKQALDVNFRKYRILGACNPNFAYKALLADDHIGHFLPCNVVVQERFEGQTEVSAINPLATMTTLKNPELDKLAQKVHDALSRVIKNIKTKQHSSLEIS